jgi:transcriptional regulator with XRE-family HTH domain
MATHSALFPALLKYWRHRRGLSQLDLALAAEVSARHLSFLETARAQPSAEMVLRLGTSLQLPLREQNALLRAAGHEAAFAEPALGAQRDSPAHRAIERMLQQQEPYPMVVMNRRYDVLSANAAAGRLFARLTLDPTRLATPPNVFHGLFDPGLSRSFVVDWERTARQLLARLHLEALERGNDPELAALLHHLLEYPDVPASWQKPDLGAPPSPTFEIRFQRERLQVAFLTTITVFAVPGNVTLEELRLESYFPLDEATEGVCQLLREGKEP